MKFFRDLSIQRKVAGVILLSSAFTVLLASAGTLAFQWRQIRANLVRDLTIQSLILADTSRAAVVFGDDRAAADLLGAMRAMPHTLRASLYLADGTLLARYQSPDLPASAEPDTSISGVNFTGNRLRLSTPVVLGEKQKGALLVEFDFAALQRERLAPYLPIAALIVAAALGCALVLASQLQRVITQPISQLADAAARVAEHRDYSIRIAEGGRDELGQLIGLFNRMLTRIQTTDIALREANTELAAEMAERTRLHRELVDMSRQSGMAEVASGVIHNVGNVLNSVNVSASLIDEQMRNSRLSLLLRATAILREQEADLPGFFARDPRGRALPAFLSQLAEQLSSEQVAWHQELGSVVRNVAHIKEIVAMQQNYARVSGLIERMPPAEVLEDALRIDKVPLERDRIEVRRDYQPCPPVSLDKHKVLQILVNLIRNARHAITDGGPSDQRIIDVRIVQVGSDRVQFVVRDTGVGIPPENLTRIFNHGFTTRKDGHGFGLHSGALAAREFGGHLFAHSDGPGKGSVFTLEIPVGPS